MTGAYSDYAVRLLFEREEDARAFAAQAERIARVAHDPDDHDTRFFGWTVDEPGVERFLLLAPGEKPALPDELYLARARLAGGSTVLPEIKVQRLAEPDLDDLTQAWPEPSVSIAETTGDIDWIWFSVKALSAEQARRMLSDCIAKYILDHAHGSSAEASGSIDGGDDA
jgi:hypothetical protein